MSSAGRQPSAAIASPVHNFNKTYEQKQFKSAS